jgi:hypothetical protein
MQWLKLVNDDAGIQSLKAANRQTPVARGVESLAPYPSVHRAQIGERRDNGAPVPPRDRRRGDRRQGDRRQHDIPVLLDTRTAHDRRGLEDRRSDNTATDAPATRRGIDVYA